MDCHLAEKVSALIDGELEREEIAFLKQHMETCVACKEAERVFLKMRDDIKAGDLNSWPLAGEGALRKILSPRGAPLWKRRILVPLPAMAALLISILALGVWLISVRSKYQPADSAKIKPSAVGARRPEEFGFDPSRFDHGERAVIIKTKIEAASPNKQ
jgi:anti-sigma factor RsiW